MDKYYEMSRGKNEANLTKKDLFNSPDIPNPSHKDSWEVWGGVTREEWVVCVRETRLSFLKITQSLVYKD
jgi:hypothetical protein